MDEDASKKSVYLTDVLIIANVTEYFKALIFSSADVCLKEYSLL